MLALFVALSAHAGPGVYLENDAFLKQTFGATPPPVQKLWLTKDLQTASSKILGHKYASLRLSYWRTGNKAAFILEEIGKEKPITIGVVVANGKISSVSILAFRETRGYEVHTPAFTRQFPGAILTDKNKLDRSIDGISGATMSVRAVTKVTRLALLFYKHTKNAPAS